MNSFLPRLVAVVLLFSTSSALALDPCPVCGGKVTSIDKVIDRDDRAKPSRNIEIWNRSMCANLLLGGALVCTRCWLCSYWYEEDWKRMSELPNSFIPPLAKAIHDFPVPADSWQYSREFDGANLTDFLEVAWDESQFARYREYCKKHDLVIELHGDTHENYFGKTVVVTDVNQPKPLEMGFTNRLVLIVKTKPKALYAKPLPPKRPVELRTAKSEYQRSAEVLRTRYVNDLLQMLKKADLAKDDLAENTVKRELKSLVLPKDSDAKELTKLLLGKWRSDGKSDNRWGPIFRREGVWNSGSEENKNESAPWHVEGNELVETYPKREDSDEITTRRFPIILLNKTQFVYLEETEFKDEIWRSVVSWERIPEAKRR